MTALPGFDQDVHELLFERAQRIARELGHRHVEPEDILIAATHVDSTARLFRHLGVQPSDLEQHLLSVAHRGSFTDSSSRAYSTESGRRMMRMVKEARRNGAKEVGAPEILLAMLQPPPSRFLFIFRVRVPPFWAALDAAGVSQAAVRRAIERTRGAA